MIIWSPFQNCSNNFLNPKPVVFSHLPQTCWLTGKFSQMWAGTRKLCCRLWREKRCSFRKVSLSILLFLSLNDPLPLWFVKAWQLLEAVYNTRFWPHNASKFSWILSWSCIITFITHLCKNMTYSCCLYLHLMSLIKPTLWHSLKWLWVATTSTIKEKLLQYSLSISFDVDRLQVFQENCSGVWFSVLLKRSECNKSKQKMEMILCGRESQQLIVLFYYYAGTTPTQA